MSTFTSRAFRDALGLFPTGVCVVTVATGAEEWTGMTVSSFNSVSLDPPIIVWSIAHSARLRCAFHNSAGFTVNVLAEDGAALARRFAHHGTRAITTAEGQAAGPNGVCLPQALVAFECRVQALVEAGDHDLVLGRVEALHHLRQAGPLCFSRGQMVGLPLAAEV